MVYLILLRFYIEFSSFDYDTVIDLSSGWAESLKCVKEFIHLALDMTKTDMFENN